MKQDFASALTVNPVARQLRAGNHRAEWLHGMVNVQDVKREDDLSERVNPEQLMSASLN